jgi:hypothetical protein
VENAIKIVTRKIDYTVNFIEYWSTCAWQGTNYRTELHIPSDHPWSADRNGFDVIYKRGQICNVQ